MKSQPLFFPGAAMAIAGNPSQWADFFPDWLLPNLLLVIVDSWRQFPKPASDDREVPITRRFLRVLRQNQELRRLPFTIDREIWLDNSADQNARIDLRFMHGYRYAVYLAFECKRLNVSFPSGKRSGADEYVLRGMARFVTQQYSAGLRDGGMIGYVMDGNCDGAIGAIEAILKQHLRTLATSDTRLRRSAILRDNPLARETEHTLPHGIFTIHHLFLP